MWQAAVSDAEEDSLHDYVGPSGGTGGGPDGELLQYGHRGYSEGRGLCDRSQLGGGEPAERGESGPNNVEGIGGGDSAKVSFKMGSR